MLGTPANDKKDESGEVLQSPKLSSGGSKTIGLPSKPFSLLCDETLLVNDRPKLDDSPKVRGLTRGRLFPNGESPSSSSASSGSLNGCTEYLPGVFPLPGVCACAIGDHQRKNVTVTPNVAITPVESLSCLGCGSGKENPVSLQWRSSSEPSLTIGGWKLEVIELLGEGAYGKVYKALSYEADGSLKVVAVKTQQSAQLQEGLPFAALREVASLKKLGSHPNIIGLLAHDVAVAESAQMEMRLVLEYGAVDLGDHLYGDFCEGPLAPDEVKRILFQMCNAVHHCHQHGVIHRDIKPGNFLIDRKGVVRLTDFGMARQSCTNRNRMTPRVATLWYRPPESLLLSTNAFQSRAVDIWSIGTIFAELLVRRPFFDGDSATHVLFDIFDVLGTPTPTNCPLSKSLVQEAKYFKYCPPTPLADHVPAAMREDEHALSLLEGLLKLDPRLRLEMFDALSHAYFNDITPELRALVHATTSSVSKKSDTLGKLMSDELIRLNTDELAKPNCELAKPSCPSCNNAIGSSDENAAKPDNENIENVWMKAEGKAA